MYLAEVKAVAFAVISSCYRSQALLYTHSDQRYIRRYGIHDPTQHYLDISVLGTSRPLYGWGRDYATDFWVSLCSMYMRISYLYSARGKYSSNTSSFKLLITALSFLVPSSIQNAREEVTTGYVTGSQGHSIRARSSRVSRKKERFGEGVEEDGKVVHLHQLEKFQIIMKKQADALIELGFDPSVKVRYGCSLCSSMYKLLRNSNLISCSECILLYTHCDIQRKYHI